ncbi:MAG: TonB-dependent siderophore receptor [Acidobacteriaceae bacterium]|nr:TonB-dependent siderophore receptor [Acidobacteriaceae bacterium]
MRTSGCNLLISALAGVLFASGQITAQAPNATDTVCSGAPTPVELAIADNQGAYIPGAHILLTCSSQTETATTNENGIVHLDVHAGTWEVRTEATGFQTQQTKVQVSPSVAALHFDVALKMRSNSETVTVSTSNGSLVSATDIGTRTETALRDVPQSLQIVSRQVLDQQQARSLNDVLRNVAGVVIPWTSGGRYESITIRGFTTMNQFKDGFRNDPSSNRAPIELSNVERVEVLKGPSSMVFGRLDPSGVVNVVTRAPSPNRAFNANFSSGSFGYRLLNLDWTGSLNKKQSVLYRLTVSGLDTKSFRNYAFTQKAFIAPVFTWVMNPTLSVRFYSEFLIQNSVNDQGLVAVGTRPANIPISTYLGDPKLIAPDRQGKAGISVDKTIGSHWVLRSYERSSVGISVYNSRTAQSLAADNRTLTLNDASSEQNFQTHYWINEAVGRLKTGPINHTILGGFQLDREINPNYAKQGVAKVTIDIYTPNYAVLPTRVLRLTNSNNADGAFGGFYLQDQIELRKNLKLTLGTRYDIAKSITDAYYTTRSHVSGRNTAWSPRTGIVYQPIERISLYATYAKSFQPQVGTTFDNTPYQPTRGELMETGIRFTNPSQRYISTVSAYQIKQTNVLTTDPIHSGYSIAVGEQRSKGIESDNTFQLTPEWNVIAGYAYAIPQVTQDNTYRVGNLLAGAPRHTGNLWTHYTFSHGSIKGLGAGVGVFGSGRRYGDLNNTYLTPGYARADMNVSYARSIRDSSRLNINFNVQNIGDRRYFEGGSTRLRIAPGAPRTFIGAITWTR